MKRLLSTALLGLCVSSCSGNSSTAPTSTPAPTATPTRIITVSGNLAFGEVNIGSTADRTFTINNGGNANLTFTSFSCTGGTGPTGYTANPTSGTVSPGATQTVNVRFAPTIGQFYSCVLSVVGDQTSGGAAINVSGTGINNTPLFTRSGTGNTVFDMPTTVARVHITGDFGGFCQNFIVRIGTGPSVVNVILGSCLGASRHYDAIALTTGGVVSITNSDGVSWSFTEVR